MPLGSKDKANQTVLFSSCVLVQQSANYSSCVEEREMFYCTKGHEHAVKCNTRPGEKQRRYTANRALSVFKHLHGQHANAKIAKNPE